MKSYSNTYNPAHTWTGLDDTLRCNDLYGVSCMASATCDSGGSIQEQLVWQQHDVCACARANDIQIANTCIVLMVAGVCALSVKNVWFNVRNYLLTLPCAFRSIRSASWTIPNRHNIRLRCDSVERLRPSDSSSHWAAIPPKWHRIGKLFHEDSAHRMKLNSRASHARRWCSHVNRSTFIICVVAAELTPICHNMAN